MKDNSLGLFRFFIRQRVFLNIVFLGVFILGMILWFRVLNREAFGNFDFDLVTVTTSYAGATAEEVEQLVTMPIENALKTVEGIDEMFSISVEALSIITLQLDPDSSNTQKVVRAIEREVDQVRTSDLPEDGDEPKVLEITAAFPVLTIGLSGDVPESALRDVAEDLEDDLLDIEGVSRVTKNGFKDKQIWVEADLKALKKNYLSLWDLIRRIREANHTSPGGRIEVAGKEILIRTIGKLETVDDVNRVVLRSNEIGNQLFVDNVATVKETLERERKFTRLNGSRSIELNVLKKDSGDTLEIDAAIKALVKEYEKERGPSVQYAFANEISFYINRRLNVLVRNGSFGIFLVLIIMFLFLSPQSAFWSTTAIPFAFLGGIITMYLTGITINLLSLFAFILVCGMLVDNGIVVAEYVERKRQEGLPSFTAVVAGVSEMSLPVFAATLTTIISFAPLAFMSGITGKFLRQMPLVLIACLVADLLECLFILPGHLYHYNWKVRVPRPIEAIRRRAQQGLSWLTKKYDKTLRFVVRSPVKTCFLLLLVFVGLLGWAKAQLRYIIFPNVIDLFVISFELPVGSTLDKTEKVALGFEEIVKTLPKDEVEAVVSQIGSQGDERRSNSGTHVGEVRVFLNKAKEDRIEGALLMDQIRPSVTQYAEEMALPKFELEEVRGGPPVGRAIEVRLIGKNTKALRALSEETKTFLKNQPGTVGISDDFNVGKQEIKLEIDRAASARAGLLPSQVAAVVRAAFEGEEATEIKRIGETDDISVRVKLREEDRMKKSTLDQLTLTTARGQQVPLRSLVRVSEGQGLLQILRTEGDRTITVRGGVDPKVTTPQAVNSALDKFLEEEVKQFSQTKYEFAGEEKKSTRIHGVFV